MDARAKENGKTGSGWGEDSEKLIDTINVQTM